MDRELNQTMTDEELVVRFQGGDERAFDELLRRYEQKIRTLCWRYLSQPDDVEDGAQETFIKAYHGLKAFHPQARFSTWLYRIAVNHCLNKIRSQRRRRWLQPFSHLYRSDDHPADSMEGGDNDPLQDLERQERIQQVRLALAALPEDQRTAVILHRFEGLSYQEIADVMACSLSAVEARLHRAKLKLAGLLAAYVEV
ncbi:sigma-70 family RNA polymerase sigma factor [candidate division KSB1 bacterium]|nr:sigma-70 family RNA polymerase sigma factor [candidate division KSB1 bacterium]